MKDYHIKYLKYKKLYKMYKGGSHESQSNYLQLNMDFRDYIIRWISIENILCKLFNKRTYLTPVKYNNDDSVECSKVESLKDCIDPCTKYWIRYNNGTKKRKCINKYRDKCGLINDVKYYNTDCNNSSKCYKYTDSDTCDNSDNSDLITSYGKFGQISDVNVKNYKCKWNSNSNLCETLYKEYEDKDHVKYIVANVYNGVDDDYLIKESCIKHYSESKKKDICAAKSRRKAFEGTELSHTITGAFNIQFKILSTVPFTTKDVRYKQTIYTQILSNENNGINDLYIAFPCGVVMDMNMLWENQDYLNYLEELYQKYILEYSASYHKVVIVGHSMGCVLALRFAYHIFKRNRSFFDERCIVLGSGGHCWIPKKSLGTTFDESFNNLPNIQVFITGYNLLDKKENKSKLLDDSDSSDDDKSDINYRVDFIVKNLINISRPDDSILNIKKYRVYYPMILLNIDTKMIDAENIPKNVKVQGMPYIHDWEQYYKLLLSLKD